MCVSVCLSVCLSVCYHASEGIAQFYAKKEGIGIGARLLKNFRRLCLQNSGERALHQCQRTSSKQVLISMLAFLHHNF